MDDDANDLSLSALVRSATGQLYRRFRSERPEGTLGDAALEVLTRLYKNGAQTLTELSRHDGVSPASMSQTVNRLTEGGYAVRVPDEADRRKVRFLTTPSGDQVARAAREQRNAWLEEQLDTLPESDQEAIARAFLVLARIAAARSEASAGAAGDSAAPDGVGGPA